MAALSLLASGILVALAVWLLGGLVLRVGGAVLAIGGLLSTAVTGSPAMAAATVLGGVGWLAGHWLYAVPTTNTPPRSRAASSTRCCPGR